MFTITRVIRVVIWSEVLCRTICSGNEIKLNSNSTQVRTALRFVELRLPPSDDFSSQWEVIERFRPHFFVAIDGANRKPRAAYIFRNDMVVPEAPQENPPSPEVLFSARTFAAYSSPKALSLQAVSRKVAYMLLSAHHENPDSFRKWLATMTPRHWEIPASVKSMLG